MEFKLLLNFIKLFSAQLRLSKCKWQSQVFNALHKCKAFLSVCNSIKFKSIFIQFRQMPKRIKTSPKWKCKLTCWKSKKQKRETELKKKAYWNGKLEKIKSINNKYAQLNSMCDGRGCGTAGSVAQATAPQMNTGHLIKHGKQKEPLPHQSHIYTAQHGSDNVWKCETM